MIITCHNQDFLIVKYIFLKPDVCYLGSALFWAQNPTFWFFLWKCLCSHSRTQGIDIFCVNIHELCCHWSQTTGFLVKHARVSQKGCFGVISHNCVGVFGKIWMPRGFVHRQEIKPFCIWSSPQALSSSFSYLNVFKEFYSTADKTHHSWPGCTELDAL